MKHYSFTSRTFHEPANSIQKNIQNTKNLLLSTIDHLKTLHQSQQIMTRPTYTTLFHEKQHEDPLFYMKDHGNFLKNIKVYNCLNLKNEIQYRFIKRLKRYFSDIIKCMDAFHHPEEVPINTPPSVAYLFHNTKGTSKEETSTINDQLLKSPKKYLSQPINSSKSSHDISFLSSSPPILFLTPISPQKVKLIKKANQQQQQQQQQHRRQQQEMSHHQKKGKEVVMNEEEFSDTPSTSKKEIDLTMSPDPSHPKISNQEKENLSTLNSSSTFFSPYNYFFNQNLNADPSEQLYLNSRSILSTLISRIKLCDEKVTADPEMKEALHLSSSSSPPPPPAETTASTSHSNPYTKENYLETIQDLYQQLKRYSPLLNILETSLQSDRSYLDAILSLGLM
ncbi:hypothetical protein BCR36DRAFT_92065 [Piromyces finnis]|uniref:Uncharacterized protein n=1 Tax=Piromyces finnis TaxID=1754191 RepID=A0A1Y1VLL4_9FUNG|nr:hypothetical protein BCR36DRAFT_92065 [Piromyces finnis]|eukprot:ORX59358.1 hypothetical protein BCR36DRAFT_92065 [Piromyces finnis]